MEVREWSLCCMSAAGGLPNREGKRSFWDFSIELLLYIY